MMAMFAFITISKYQFELKSYLIKFSPTFYPKLTNFDGIINEKICNFWHS